MAQIQGSREQILISAYNDGYEFFNQYKQNTQAFYDKAVQNAKDEQLAMQILGFSPVGWIYYLGKGLYNGVVGLGEGFAVMLTNLFNNFVQTFLVHEHDVGSSEWFKEFAGDLLYMASSGLLDSAQGIANGALNFAGNLGGIAGITPEWTNGAKEFINKSTYDTKAQILNFQYGRVDRSPSVLPNFREPEEHTFDITKDAIKGIDAFANNIYWKEDFFAPYMQDNPATKKAYEIYAGTLESIGRMIPSITITALTGGSSAGVLASSGYFYATTYGQSFNEAINKGLTIEDANLYATQIAGIETLTEQIGGFTFSGGIGKDILSNVINEGIEEVIAEMATDGTTFDEQGKPIYEKPSEILERVLTAGFTGALSGGIMSGGQIWYTASQKGTAYNYLDDIQKTIMKSVSKEGLDNVQKSITKSLDDGLEGLNKVKNKKNLEKTKKYLSESQASLFIEFDNKTNQFVLTDFGKEIHSDIRARQGTTIITDDYVASVSPATKIQENITVEEINKNGKQITVNEKINLLQKNSSKYEKNKEIINKIFEMSKKMGMSVAFYDGDLRNSQGFYYNGVSYININSDGVNGKNLLKQVYAHEIFHQIFDKYKNGLLSKKAQKNVLKLMDTVLEAMKNDDKFLNEVANKTSYIKDDSVLKEEHLAYFIEKYVNMDNVIERFAWRSPNIFRKMIDQITGVRSDGKMSIIEEQYLNLLKEIELQSVDSISAILQLSRLTPENVKHSKLVQRKMYNKKKNAYSYLVDKLILVDKKGNYILPKEIEKSFIIKSDSDVVNHKDYKAFALALRNKDVKALVDNFLATDQKNETLFKRLIGIKSAHLFEYMEENKFYRHNEVMEMIRNDLVAEIDKRLAEQKELLKGKEVVEGNLIKVNAESFWNVFALNYMKMWRKNYVSLYPLSVYENTEHLYLRDDLLAGFAVQGEKNPKNEAFNRYELASLFRSGGDAGWLKSKVDFIVQKLGARYLASISENVAQMYNSVFNNAISVVRKTFKANESDFIQEIENGGYSNMYMALDWSASYSNYLISELALYEDNPTYMGIHQIGYSEEGTEKPSIYFSKQAYVTESQYETLKDTLVKDEKGNVIPVYQSIDSKDNPVVTSFVGSSLINSGYCFLGNSDYFKNDNTYVIDVFVNITNSFDQKTTINQFTFEKIMAEAVKTVKSLTPETIEKYRQRFIENDEQNFLGIFEPISCTLGNTEDLLNLKKSITNVTGLDGYIGRNSTNEIISVTAWYEEQIKGVNSIFTSKNQKDYFLFSPEEMVADKLKDQIEFIFKQRILNKDFERITNQELIDNGYIFKITGKPFYLNKRHFRLPVNYDIQDVQYNKEHNELILKIMNNDSENKYTSDLLVTQDYIVMDGDKIEKIYRNARYLSFGTTEIRLEDLAKTGKSISQSIALEDASDTYPESLFFTQEKRGLPSTFILLKSDVLNKKDTIVGSNDYFTKTRKIFDNYTMMFDTDGLLEKTQEEKEQMYRVALKEIRKNNGVLTEEIEKRFDIYDNNDPNFDLKISKSTNDHFIKQMQKYIKEGSSFINGDRFWQLRTIQILRDLVFVGQTNNTTVSDSNRDNRFLYSFDEALESLTNLYKKYGNISDIVENIKVATNKNLEEYKMKEYLSTLPYNYYTGSHEVREIKANIVLSDVEAVFYKDGDINQFQDYYDDIELEKFYEKSEKHKQALDEFRKKGVKVLRVANKESFNHAILKATNFEVINHKNTLFSKADNGQMLAENSTVDVDSMISRVMFSKAYVPVVSSDKTSALNNLNSVKVYEHNKKNYKELERVYATFLDTYKPAKTTTTDKIIAKLVENIESRIRTNNNKIQLYNHLYINVAKYLVIQINAMNVPNAQKTTNMEREILISGTNEIIARTMTYLDSTFNNNDINISKYNPNGYQYIRKINWAMREVLDNNNHKHDGVAFIQELYDAIFQLDITDKTSMEGFYDALTKFEERTNIAQVNSCALDSEGEFAHTIPNVKKQANLWIESAIDIVGRLLPYYDKKGKRKIKRNGGLIGDNMLIDNLNIAKWIADPFTLAEVSSLYMKNALPQVIQNRLFAGSKKQLEVLNLVSEYFEKGGWLKKNTKKIEALEKNYVGIKNLLDANGNPTNMSQSQVITLYRTLLREIILNRAIDEGHIIGVKTNHFANDNKVKITENVKNKLEREAKGREAKIVDNIALLNELGALMESDAFMKEYSKKTMAFFEMLYPYVNASFKDINGLELNNDAETIKEALNDMDESEKEQLLKDLPEGLDLSQIYIPFRNAGQSYMGRGAFDVNNILDLGIFDGITQSLTDSSSMLLIDSINNLIPTYGKEVANYYGIYRIATDLNVLFGTQQAVDGTTQVENLAQKMTEYNPEIVRFYEELLKDMAGYSTLKDGVSQSFDKLLATLRKNFFRASLALNVKVIATQFASMITCGTIFGDGSNLFSNTGFMAKFTKNLFMAGSKTKAKYLIENSEIYKNRSKMSTYEISEATEKGFTKNPVSNAVEFLMSGITLTDNMINRALFITLTETIDPETNAMYTEEKAMTKVEEAIERYQSSGDAISRSELLRTENQVLRLFTKFLGEPMKMLTNFYGVSKNLRVIHHFEKNKVKILEFFEAKKLAVENNLDIEKNKYQDRLDYQNTPEFDKLSDKEKRQYALENEKERKKLAQLEFSSAQQKRIYDNINKNVEEVIADKPKVKEKLARLVTAFAGSLMWQVALGMIFKLIRGGAKDKPEEEEMWTYLSKMFGHQLGIEFFGYFPFLRDVYSVVINGFSANDIDELQAFNDLGLQLSYLITDIANGGDFNAGRHIRQFALSMGSALGIPARNIERLFTTPMSWFSEVGTFKYKSATGQRVDVNQELTNAVENQDEKMIEAIIAQKLNDRNIMLGQDVVDELERLAGVNGKMIQISGDYGSFKIDGEEYILTREQQEKFTEIYSRADYIASKIIKSEGYKKLNDAYKAKFLTAIFNYFYRMAKQEISGKKLIAEKNYFSTLEEAYAYFSSAVAERLYNTMINEQEKGEA